MFFADISSVPAAFIKDYAVTGVALLMAAHYGKLVFRGRQAEPREIAPQPLVVKPADAFVTREACHTLHQETLRRIEAAERAIDAIRAEAKEDRREILLALANEIRPIHSRLNTITEKIGELRGANE